MSQPQPEALMPGPPVDLLDGPEDAEKAGVAAWRALCLIEAGYPPDIAMRLAERFHGQDIVDLHLAVDLVKRRGCSPRLAERILG